MFFSGIDDVFLYVAQRLIKLHEKPDRFLESDVFSHIDLDSDQAVTVTAETPEHRAKCCWKKKLSDSSYCPAN